MIEVQNKPHVNPLSVSTNSSDKKRLILDLRYVSKHLWKQSVKFEDWKTFQNYVKSGSFMYKFDMRHGYHHTNIFLEHQTYLGFSGFYEGKLRYFVFTVLLFGLSVASYCFTNIVRALVKFWRSNGIKIVVLIDASAEDSCESKFQFKICKQSLVDFRFLPNEKKYLVSSSVVRMARKCNPNC